MLCTAWSSVSINSMSERLAPNAATPIKTAVNTPDIFIILPGIFRLFGNLRGALFGINYTVIGDNVNLAARIQDLTKTYKWPILVSEATYQQVKDEFECELVDSVVVKGKTEVVNLYSVRGVKGTQPDQLIQSWTSL